MNSICTASVKSALNIEIMKPFFFLIILVLSACQSTTLAEEKPTVVVSFYPLEFLTKTIAGDTVKVVNMATPGIEPHDYYPTPKDIETMNTADLVLAMGGHFEPWSEALYHDQYADTEGSILVFSQEMEFALQDDGVDPHVWLDPIRAQEMVNLIETELSQVLPKEQENFALRADALRTRLRSLFETFQLGLQDCERRSLIVSHDAFSYFGERFNLELFAITGLSPEDEPSLEHLAALIDLARETEATSLFMETLAIPDLTQTLASETGLEILTLNPLEGLTREEIAAGEDYFSVMQSNLENLKIGLSCQ